MRFTLAACLALTAVIAVLCYLLTAAPSPISYVLMMAVTIFAPICAVAGIVYGRDNLRAFCIGAVFPLALLVWSSAGHFQEISLNPADYGWTTQGQTGEQLASATVTYYDSYVQNVLVGNSGSAPMPGGTTPQVLARAWLSGNNATVTRAATMRNPTCVLSIAAIFGGALVMAIRGGLKRKESVVTENADE
jgi:hypothetical protein